MGTISRMARFPLARPLVLGAAAIGRRPRDGSWGGFAGRVRDLARDLVRGLVGLLYLWERRLRDRDILQQMTAAQLKDIGLSRADALNEAEKPFWRA